MNRTGLAAASWVLMLAVLAASCSDAEPDAAMPDSSAGPTTAASVEQVSTTAGSIVTTTTTPPITAALATTSSTTTTTTTTTTTVVVAVGMSVPAEVAYVYPIAPEVNSGYGQTHAGYSATDIFASCGTPVHSPVYGTVLDLRRVDPWSADVDDPFTRGGLYVSILGDDGVRYYVAHFSSIPDDVVVGARVVPGSLIGVLGDTGRSSACHAHVGISPPCAESEWWVRRGIVWPYPYFDDWRRGVQRSPAAEVAEWLAARPQACTTPP